MQISCQIIKCEIQHFLEAKYKFKEKNGRGVGKGKFVLLWKSRTQKLLETLTAMQENIVCLHSQNFPRKALPPTHTNTHAHSHAHRSRDLWFLRFAHPGDFRKRLERVFEAVWEGNKEVVGWENAGKGLLSFLFPGINIRGFSDSFTVWRNSFTSSLVYTSTHNQTTKTHQSRI